MYPCHYLIFLSATHQALFIYSFWWLTPESEPIWIWPLETLFAQLPDQPSPLSQRLGEMRASTFVFALVSPFGCQKCQCRHVLGTIPNSERSPAYIQMSFFGQNCLFSVLLLHWPQTQCRCPAFVLVSGLLDSVLGFGMHNNLNNCYLNAMFMFNYRGSTTDPSGGLRSVRCSSLIDIFIMHIRWSVILATLPPLHPSFFPSVHQRCP